MVIHVGETTTLTFAATNKASLRTTVPMSVVKQFNLQSGDKLDWSFEIKDNELVMVIHPTKK